MTITGYLVTNTGTEGSVLFAANGGGWAYWFAEINNAQKKGVTYTVIPQWED